MISQLFAFCALFILVSASRVNIPFRVDLQTNCIQRDSTCTQWVTSGTIVERDTCFPGNALVTMADGVTTTRMDKLQIGDALLGANNATVTVLDWLHRSPDAVSMHSNLITEDGITFTATAEHYVFTRERGMVSTGSVRVGETLLIHKGKNDTEHESRIAYTPKRPMHGLFNPLVSGGGEIYVNGVLCHAYMTNHLPVSTDWMVRWKATSPDGNAFYNNTVGDWVHPLLRSVRYWTFRGDPRPSQETMGVEILTHKDGTRNGTLFLPGGEKRELSHLERYERSSNRNDDDDDDNSDEERQRKIIVMVSAFSAAIKPVITV